MSGLVEPHIWGFGKDTARGAGQFLDSTPGRVLAGVATGGASEVGREAALVARKNVRDPTLAAGLGAAAGGASNLGNSSGAVVGAANAAPNTVSKVAPVVPLTAQAVVPVAGTAASSLTKSTDDANAAAQAQQDQASRTVAQQQTDAANDLAARTQTPQQMLEARRRASLAATGLPQGRKRASQYLSGASV